MDIIWLVLGIGFFAASSWFVGACASLEPRGERKE
jgi:hypothetical protein